MNIMPSIIYALIFSVLNIFAQNQSKFDSLLHVYSVQKEEATKVETIGKIVKSQFCSNPEIARKYVEEMIKLSKKINYRTGITTSHYYLGVYFLSKRLLDSAEIYFKKSILFNTKHTHKHLSLLVENYTTLGAIYWSKKKFDSAFHYINKTITLYNNRDSCSTKQNEVFKDIGRSYNILGLAYLDLGMYNLALKNEFKALELYNKKGLGTSIKVANVKNTLGLIEIKLGNYKQALIYLDEAETLIMPNSNYRTLGFVMMNKALVLSYLKEEDKAIDINEKCLSLVKEHGYKDIEAKVWLNMGKSYRALGKDKESINSYRKALKLHKDLNQELPVVYMNIGIYYFDRDVLDSALYYLNKTIKVSEATHDLEFSSLGYFNRYLVYKEMGKYKQSIEDYEAYTKLKDSMFNKTKSQQIEELRTIYETEKKEQQIKIQKQEINVLNIKEKVNSMQRSLLAFGLLIALIGVYAIYQKNKRHRVAKEKAEIDLEYKTKKLTTYALHLAKKNEVLNDIKKKVKIFKADASADPGYQTLIQTINFDIQDDNSWGTFSKYFEEVHKDFNAKAQQQFPNITPNDLRLMALMKMNLSSKEIANALNISSDGIKKSRQRLRKKMGLEPTDSLEAVIIAI